MFQIKSLQNTLNTNNIANSIVSMPPYEFTIQALALITAKDNYPAKHLTVTAIPA